MSFNVLVGLDDLPKLNKTIACLNHLHTHSSDVSDEMLDDLQEVTQWLQKMYDILSGDFSLLEPVQ